MKPTPSASQLNMSHKKCPTLARLAGRLLLVHLAFSIFHSAFGATVNPPNSMTYQGFLVDANGNPLGSDSPKNYDVIFRIYDNQSGGTLKWSEFQTVTVDKGYFSVLLGEGSDNPPDPRGSLSQIFSASDASDRYIQMTVKGIGANGSAVDILPRLQLMSSPYSFLAQNSVNAANLVNSTNGPVVTVSGTSVGINKSLPNSALDVNGTVTATAFSGAFTGSFSGNGASLTSINGANITGTLSDERLSSNVALLNGNQVFTGGNTFRGATYFMSSPVGIRTFNPAADLDVGGYAANGALRTVLARHSEGDTTGAGTFLGVRAWATQQDTFNGKSFSLEHSFYGSVNNAINFYRGSSTTGGYIKFAAGDGTESVTIGRSGLSVNGLGYASTNQNGVNWNFGTGISGHFLFGPSTGTGAYIDNTDGSYNTTSDRRLKHDIREETGLLDKVLKLRPVSFHYNSVPDGPRVFGFIAQEVEPLFPEVVGEDSKGFKSLAYSELIPISISALQELTKKVEQLQESQARIALLEKEVLKVQSLQQELAELKKIVRQFAQAQPDSAAINE